MSRSKIPTVRQTLKSQSEQEYWNNYLAAKMGVTMETDIHALMQGIAQFNTMYQDQWMDKPINEYCDAIARYVNLLGLNND